MSKKYEVLRKGRESGQMIAKYDAAVAELISRVPQGDSYQWKKRGEVTWHNVPSKPALRAALEDRNPPVGEAFWARRKGGTATYVLRVVEVITVPDCPISDPTPAIKALWDAGYRAFLDLGDDYEFVYMGGFVCRRIDGSTTWSQHAHHNAYDFRIRRKSAPDDTIDTAATTKVVNDVKALAAEALWQVAGHYFHAHLTGDPKRFGTPACA